MTEIWTIAHKQQETFLRRPAAAFVAERFTKKEIRELVRRMRAAMKQARGIGLSANQIGLDLRVFVAQVENKFYAIFNPTITKTSAERETLEEGCLSVPDTYGLVERPARVTLEGEDASGKKVKVKAWGLLARVFQHEIDHLNGVLFIDHAKKIYRIPSSEQLQKRQEKLSQ